MANTATYDDLYHICDGAFVVTAKKVTITGDASSDTMSLSVPHGGPTGAEPFQTVVYRTGGTDSGNMEAATITNNDTTNDEVDITYINNANIEAATVILRCVFWFVASGSSTNGVDAYTPT